MTPEEDLRTEEDGKTKSELSVHGRESSSLRKLREASVDAIRGEAVSYHVALVSGVNA